MIRLDDIAIRRGGVDLMTGVSFTMQPGSVYAVIGPNGAGKTSLLRAIFGDLPLSAGAITVGKDRLTAAGGRRFREPRRWRDRFAYMPQDTHLDVALTVLEVVVLGRLGRLGLHVDDATLALATERLREAGILHLADRYISTLSGGQRQMALFAQVLMREPMAMLLDEPVSALDLRHQIHLLDLVRRETRKRNLTTAVVLHDLNLACQFADRIVVLRPGGLSAFGPPQEVMTAELIAETYRARVEILRDSCGRPVIQPLGEMTDAVSGTEGREP